MQFRFGRTVLAAALVSAMALTGCSSNHNTHKAQPCPAPTKSSEVSKTRKVEDPKTQAATEYLQSVERNDKFQTIVPKAGIAIAKALEAGKFGKVKRYNAWKKDLQPGEVGWGGISSKDNGEFAWVYWKADGTVDYTKPICQIGTTSATGSKATRVTVFGPDKDDEVSYWQVYKAIDSQRIEVTDTLGIQFPDIDMPKDDKFISPSSLELLKELDAAALAQLQADMVSQFGKNWAK